MISRVKHGFSQGDWTVEQHVDSEITLWDDNVLRWWCLNIGRWQKTWGEKLPYLRYVLEVEPTEVSSGIDTGDTEN